MAMSILFLSDGRPSDGYGVEERYKIELDILSMVNEICAIYKERLTFGFFGFA